MPAISQNIIFPILDRILVKAILSYFDSNVYFKEVFIAEKATSELLL